MTEPVFHLIPTSYGRDDDEECATCGEYLNGHGPGYMMTRSNGQSVRLTHHCSEAHAIEYATPEITR